MPNFNTYPQKLAPGPADTVLIYDAEATPPAVKQAALASVAAVTAALAGTWGGALTAWLASLASRHYAANVSVTCIGTSITAGSFLSSWEQTWPVMAQNELNSRFPSIGLATHGRGLLIPKLGATGITPDYVTVTGTPGTLSGTGYNLASYDISAGGGVTFAYHLTGTSADITYLRYSGGGTFSYQVDSGTVTNVSTNGASSVQLTPVTLGGGAHTLTIRFVSGSSTYIAGVYEFNGDENSGIQVYNCGATGSTAAQWAAADMSAVVFSFSSIFVIELGVNDAGIVSAAAFQASLTTLIGNLVSVAAAESAPVPQFILLACYQQTGTTSPPWSAYVQAMYNIAAARTDTTVLDLTLRMPQAQVGGGPYGLYYTDGDHPSKIGHSAIADIATGFLSPR